MTLDEAINHAYNVYDASKRLSANCDTKSCGMEHLQLANWLNDYKSLTMKYQYLASDFSNYKRRTEENNNLIKKESNKEIVLKLLNTVDDMERLMKQCHLNELSHDIRSDIDGITSGFQMIYENLIKLLESEGCQKIEVSYGDKFNPEYHEAVFAKDIRDDEEYATGDICEIYQSGWLFNGKLLRPVKVVVCN